MVHFWGLFGDLGFSGVGRSPSRSAVQVLLERSLSAEADQKDEGMETLGGILLIVWTPGGCVGSLPSMGRGSAGRGRQSSCVTPQDVRARTSTPRSVASSDPAADFGGVALRFSHHSTGPANSGTATRGTQFNVLGCS